VNRSLGNRLRRLARERVPAFESEKGRQCFDCLNPNRPASAEKRTIESRVTHSPGWEEEESPIGEKNV